MMVSPREAVRVRIAPSPTGHLHLGTARTALFNWLFARTHGGKFLVRIEDTDRARSLPEYEKEILEGLLWLGLPWDEGPELHGGKKGAFGPYRQSERGAIYEKYVERLLAEGKAYRCYCTKEELEAERQVMLASGLPPKYGGHCRNLTAPPRGRSSAAIRFKTPQARVEFSDLIRGKVSFDASLFGDMVIAKDLAVPLYNLAVVVDDAEMHISHVIRGEDHLPNTPKQILLIRALGLREPAYAHLPLILGKGREKLSKRFAENSLLEYRERGYLPEALINFLALLGWHPAGDEEVFSPDALAAKFDLKRVQKAGAAFDEEKLEWLNAEHMKLLPEDELVRRLVAFLGNTNMVRDVEFLRKVVRVERGRMKTLGGFLELAGFFFALPDYEARLLIWQDASPVHAREILNRVYGILEALSDGQYARERLQSALEALIRSEGRGEVLWPLRVAVSGRPASPDPLEIIAVLGKEETLRRVMTAIEKLTAFLES